MDFMPVGSTPHPMRQYYIITAEADGTEVLVDSEAIDMLEQMPGSIILPTWEDCNFSTEFCKTHDVKVVDGPDQAPPILAAHYRHLHNLICDMEGFWIIPPMNWDEQWCLLHTRPHTFSCAIAVARVDGKEEGFRVRDADVYNLMEYAEAVSNSHDHDHDHMHTVIRYSTCTVDKAEFEWRFWCPENIPV